MAMDQTFTAFYDELQKLAISKKEAPFMQGRKGRRPIRVARLLEREKASATEPMDDDTSDSAPEVEGGAGMSEKLGADKENLRDRAMMGFVKARPYAASAARVGIPAALAGKMLFEGGSGRLAAHAGRTMGVIGAGAGVANEALQQWARKHKRRKAAKEILKQGGVSTGFSTGASTMRKVAAMASDLRRTGIGGVKRPPFPTEDSKQMAFQRLTTSRDPGKFLNTTKPRHLRAPGPSIGQVAPMPR